ncbi:MAG: SUMF1/EgtB/PvdO family nonheme iron enzyme [Okeania sp. SIO3I5]|uniref:bifunctional serine/threonine-protein kinase/formylglycine-generating enzyme family protein n=1 Tax=Okeania sp. SIO3I5 TaxID=2607805 RepID=UPI0013B76CDD|nr:bifunctional serine/threonine-protein kinase/formylglycine-generating enzyme family protein [Okeania sp. SIO3I5]NEQ38078.1 SUMF1/EgtB/PvdO family nonheme iron enzyme [Okeania sp. SIO3I5]
MQSGKILRNHYKIIDSLGSGGFGDTYLAEDLDLPGNPKRVVKHLSPKEQLEQLSKQSDQRILLDDAKKRFEKEAKTLDKLGKDSDQIPELFDYFQEGTEFYLVQEYIEGHDISKELTLGKKLSESDTIALLKGILEALAVAHQNNIIHRDIKPQNLMRRKSDNKIVLIDFGAVKEISVLTTGKQRGKTTLTVAIGTPAYMPTEQIKGKPKPSSDIYAVGIIGIQALTGKHLDDFPTDSKTGNASWRNEVQVSNCLADILDKMVHESFRQRYQNATKVLEALNLMIARTTQDPKPNKIKRVVADFGYYLYFWVVAKLLNNKYFKLFSFHFHTLIQQRRKTVAAKPQSQLQANQTRRQILILGGLAGSGFVAAIWSRDLKDKPSAEIISTPQPIPDTTPEIISTPEPTPVTPLPQQPKISIQKFTTVTVNSRGEKISSDPGEVEVMTENLGNKVSLEMVKIPAGKFLMGSPETEAWRQNNESPQHYVDVPEFFMGKYPVTQAQWKAVMGNNPSYFKGANRPVENVSWNDATEFCRKLSQITGKKYSLPSESQWEYACRARTSTPFYFGETITSELVNFNGSYIYRNAPKGKYREETTNVGTFPPNAFGLYDMHGNVWEWCADDWHDNYNGAPTDGSVWLEGNKNLSPLRGGSWFLDPGFCRSAYRNYDLRRDILKNQYGFRVVCDSGITL